MCIRDSPWTGRGEAGVAPSWPASRRRQTPYRRSSGHDESQRPRSGADRLGRADVCRGRDDGGGDRGRARHQGLAVLGAAAAEGLEPPLPGRRAHRQRGVGAAQGAPGEPGSRRRGRGPRRRRRSRRIRRGRRGRSARRGRPARASALPAPGAPAGGRPGARAAPAGDRRRPPRRPRDRRRPGAGRPHGGVARPHLDHAPKNPWHAGRDP